jgi:hypothetical protein
VRRRPGRRGRADPRGPKVLTRLRGGGYGSRPLAARTRTLSLALLLLAGGCHDAVPVVPPPLDRFYFPTSIALRHPGSCAAGTPGCTQLLVASSNFDLRYDPTNGGTVLAVDVESALEGSLPDAAPTLPLNAILGTAQVGSFTGELAVLDETTCTNWDAAHPQVLVTSRSQRALYRLDLSTGGALDCGAACKVPLDTTLADPYGVTVACGNYPAAPPIDGSPPDLAPKDQQFLAFISYLRAPSAEGWLSRVDLTGGAPRTQIDLGFDPIATTAFDPARGLLYTTAHFGTLGTAPLRAYDLAAPQVQPITANLFDIIRGAELTDLALSSDGTRAYVALRIYDPALAISLNARPAADLAAALAVIDLSQLLSGAPAASAILRVVPVDRGASEVRTLARPTIPPAVAVRDLVAIASPDDNTVTLYDDETGRVAQVIGACGSPGAAAAPQPCAPGDPALGKQPFSLAFESLPALPDGTAQARLFVASFDRSWVNVLTFDPTHPSEPVKLPDPATPAKLNWLRIGPERP